MNGVFFTPLIRKGFKQLEHHIEKFEDQMKETPVAFLDITSSKENQEELNAQYILKMEKQVGMSYKDQLLQ